ncbi:hypothetical protein ACFQ3K_15570 [Brucella gallinifaecis]|uniref:hypothetical protein n=1 Tax=Brucella gallinifaecis TaxID=215590 RepID=UPI00112D9A7A
MKRKTKNNSALQRKIERTAPVHSKNLGQTCFEARLIRRKTNPFTNWFDNNAKNALWFHTENNKYSTYKKIEPVSGWTRKRQFPDK